jgi:hypothetical protein
MDAHHISRQDRLLEVLGAADLRRRLLPRGAHALRRDGAAEPALLRVDPRVDRTRVCEIYGELAERNPAWLERFDREPSPMEVS